MTDALRRLSFVVKSRKIDWQASTRIAREIRTDGQSLHSQSWKYLVDDKNRYIAFILAKRSIKQEILPSEYEKAEVSNRGCRM